MKRFYAGICLVSIFCLGFVSGLRAQNFGTGFQTEIWLKADEVRENAITGNNVAVTVWDNKSLAGTSRDFIQTSVTAPTPIYSHAGMNFNPSVYFSAASLKSRNTFTTSSGSGGRNYMTFWVARRTALADYSCVFNYRDGAVYDEGWRRNNDAYFHGTAISFVSALGKTYGVVGADRSGGKIYRNALSGTVTPRSVPNGASTALLGARNATPAVATRFTGDIQEFILLSVPSGSSFTDADVHKINSYLMIKYGQHPESPTLVNSDGNPVWTAASSTGYTGNVFALGRDDVTGLNQKQSASVEDDVLAAFLGNTIFTLNAQNTETFALDKTYLAFGSNMLNGFESYSYPAGTGFQNGASTAAFSRRQKLVYKTNLSGAASLTVGLRVRLNATHVLVSASPTFAPANTRIYPVTNGIATGVQIDNTYQYIGFVTPNEGPGLSASNTLELWLKADDVQPGNEPAAGTALRRWQNLSGAAMDFVQRDSEAVPIYSADGMNYHPALRFGASGAPTKLVSSSNFATEASSARRYRSFHVTRFDYKNGNNYGNVFSYRENYSAEGWTNDPSTEAYYSGCGASSNVALRAPALPLEKRFGIMSFDRGTDPNCAALTPPNEAVWYNARPSPINVYSRPITASTTTKAIIGVKNASSDDVYRGDIQEIIILSTPAGSNFAPDDVNKINTYLAVKYGQTLDSLSQPEWKSSDGTVIWSASAAGYTGYCKNVFGIGRDDAFALYQKQSLSEGSSEKITVFLGDPALPALNSQNESTLSNGQFLMFGSNGIVSNNANRVVYSYPAGTAFAGGSLAAALDYRHATVLRARTTGPASSFVANVFAGGLKAEYLLVSSNPAFPAGSSGGTRIYRFDGNNVAATVTINNGDYLAFAYAEKSPGGVSSDMRMWLKADEPSSLDIDGVTGEVQEWRDFSGNSDNIKYLYQNLGSTGPQTRPAFRRIDPAMNYHPAVDFRAFGEYLVTDKAPFSEAKPENFTIVSTVHLRQYGETTGEGNISYLMGFGRKALSTVHGSATSIYHRQPAIGLGVVSNVQGVGRSIYRADVGVNGMVSLYNPNATTVTMHMTYFNKAVTSTTNIDRFVRFEADGMSEEIHYNSPYIGRPQPAVGNHLGTLTNDMLMNGEGTLGSGSRYSRNVMGTMSEIIAYEKLLSDDEKSKVYSYLGLKYGITLDLDKSGPPTSTSNFNYKLSDGTTVVWNGDIADNNVYHNNVAAIVRDDAAKLNNLQSHSTDDGAAVLMGIGTRIGLNPELTGLNSDKEFIVWGNNGVAYSERQLYNPDGADADICGIMTQRLKRIWKVRTGTHTPYSVIIGAFPDLSAAPFPYGADFSVAMLIADDPAKFANKTWDIAIPGVYMDNMHQFGFIFEPNQTYYFTFGALPNPYGSGCETCDPDNRPNRIDFYQWPRGGTSKTYILNTDGFEATVSTRFTGAGGNAYFPAGFPYGGAQLYIRRLGDRLKTMRTSIELDKAALAVFDVRKLDYYYGRYNTVEIYGFCGNERIVPRLNYATVPSTATYNILGGGRAEAKKVNLAVGNRRTWMYVEFDRPVHTIHIDNAMLGTSGLKDFGVGPIDLYCPAPPPPVNEDGLAITQQAIPQSVLLCNEVTYTFHIINDNCNAKKVQFKAPLQAGMLWREGSLTLDPAKVSGTVSISGGNLIIDSLIVAGSEVTVFSARAYFALSATAGIYSNRAEIGYNRIVGGVPIHILHESCDRLTAGCEPTRVEALYSPRLNPLQITSSGIDGRRCYRADDEVAVSITINNPNSATVSQAGFDAIYNEDFTLMPGTLTTTSGLTGVGTPVTGTGFFSLEGSSGTGFSIPSGSHTLSFKLKAGNQLLPDYNPDGTVMKYASGDTVYLDFNLSASFVTLSSVDDCSPMIFDSAYAEFSVPAVPKVRIYGTKSICPSHTTTLSHWEAGSWTSKNPDIATVSGNTVTAVSAGKAVFTFTLAGLEGVNACTAESDTLTVTATDISISKDTLCVGTTATLSPSSGGTWSSNNPTVAAVSGNTVSALAAGTATLRFTAADGCTNALDILVMTPPSVSSFSYGTNDTLCQSTTSAMPTLVGTAGGSFSVSPATGLSLNASTGEINPSASTNGTYTVTYTIPAHGTCSQYSRDATVIISVCGDFTLSATVSDSEVCVGDSTNVLITLTNGGISALSNVQVVIDLSSWSEFSLITTPVYSLGTWTPGVWVISSLAAGQQATFSLNLRAGATAGSYPNPVWVRSFDGSPMIGYGAAPSNLKATVTLTINPVPAIQYTETSVCVGSQITFSAAGVTSWISSNTAVASVSFGGTVTGISAGTAWIKAVNANNCADSVEITVNPRPVPGISSGFGSSFCLNDPARNVTSYGTPAGGTFKGAGITGSVGAWTFDPAAAGTGTHLIRYVVTNLSGCSDSVEHTVVVRDAPSNVTIAGGDTTLCSSVSAYSLIGSPSGGTFYLQVSVPGALSGSTFFPSVAGVGTHRVIYYYTTGAGCGGRDTIVITVAAAPSFTLPSSVCDKNRVPLNGTPSGGVFSGTGVELDGGQYYFNSVLAGAGSHVITYTVGKCSTSHSISVGVIQPSAGRIYVDSSRNGNGSSWACALNSLARAMRYAREHPASANEIWVAGGTYHPEDYIDYVEGIDSSDRTFLLPTDARIYGSFRGADGIAGFTGETNIDQRPFLRGGLNDSVVRIYSTILSGDPKDNDTEGNFALNRDDNLHHVVISVNGTSSATLDGFTIKGGNATKDSTLMFGPDPFHGRSGAGLWILRSSARFSNLKIFDNKATNNGGGILIRNAAPVLNHVYVHGNEAGTGAGISAESSSTPSILNAVVAGNSAQTSGGGVLFLNSNGSIANVLIAGNHAGGDGGGLAANRDVATGWIWITNVTITGNSAGGNGGGLFGDGVRTNFRMRNSILTGNTASLHDEFSPDDMISNGYLHCYYSYVGGVTSFTAPSSNNLDGTANIDFVAPASSPAPTTAGNYRLKAASPAIGTGNTAYLQPGGSPAGAPDLSVLVRDIDGKERIYKSKIDLGPYQVQASKANIEYPDNVVGDDDCQIPPPNFAWDVVSLLSSDIPAELSTKNIPLAGDIDGDGYIEIIASGADGGNTAKNIIIYKVYATDSIVKTQTISIEKLHHNSPYAIADINGDGKAELFVVNGGTGFPNAYKLSCYHLNASNNYVHKWTASMPYYDQTETPAFQPMIADFDSDGVPEVLVGDKVYQSASGAMLVDLSLLMTSYGLGGNAVHTTSNKNPSSVMAVADFNNDGILEIAAGDKVYSLDLSYSVVVKTCPYAPGVGDGFTSIADIDLDGSLDVVVTRKEGSTVYIYAWNPISEQLIAGPVSFSSTSDDLGASIAAIGNVNFTPNPEILVVVPTGTGTSELRLYDHELNYISSRLGASTGTAGVSLFDFNQDGRQEILWKINGVTEIDSVNTTTGAIGIHNFAICGSHSANEYPVVADVTGNGSAEIVVIASLSGTDGNAGRIYVLAQKEGLFAPARPVWNQAAYNSVNINKDLKVPTPQTSPAMVFPGGGLMPLNAYLQQQTLLDSTGAAVWVTPDVKADTLNFNIHYYEAEDSLTVSFNVENIGSHVFGSPLYVAAYNAASNAAANESNLIARDSVRDNLKVGDIKTFTLKIPHLVSRGITGVVIRINDKGKAHYVRLECDTANNHLEFDPPIIEAPADTAVCAASPLVLSAAYSVGSQLVSSVHYKWEHRPTSAHPWTTKSEGDIATPASDTLKLIIASFADTDTGFYRVSIASVGQPVYIADSKEFFVSLAECDKMMLSKTADRTSLCVNDSVTFTIVAENVAVYASALNVSVKDVWPQILSAPVIVSTTNSTVASYSSGTVTWDIGTVVAGRKDTLVISGRVLPATGMISDSTNKAYVATVDTFTYASYNAAPDDLKDSVKINVNCAGLTLSKTADRLNPCVNDSVTYTIVLVNDSPNAILNVSVKDEWPQVLSNPVVVHKTGSSTASFASGIVDWSIGGMLAGQKDTLVIAGRVFRSGTGLASDTINKAYVATAGTIVNGSYADAHAEMRDSVSINVNCEGLILSKTADNVNLCVRDSVTFTVVASNNSSGGLLNVTVRDIWAPILSSADIVYTTGTTTASFAAGIVEWNIGTMSAGRKDTLIIAGRVLSAGSGLSSDTVNRTYVSTTGTTVHPTYADAPANMRDSVILLVGALPAIDFAPVDSICIDNLPLTLTASATPAGGTGAFSGNGVTGNQFDPPKSGIYTVTYTYTAPNGCTDSVSANIEVLSVPAVPDIRLKICPSPDKEIILGAYLDSTSGSITWTPVFSPNIILLDATVGRIRGEFLRNYTYTYKYVLSLASCGTSTARLTINTTKINAIREIDTIVMCPTLDSNIYVQLNQILGFELGGVWTYDNTLNPDNTVIDNTLLYPSSSRFAGALVFNAAKAWRDASSAYNISYNGDNQAKKFVFKYTPPAGSCLTKTRTIVIIATPMWM